MESEIFACFLWIFVRVAIFTAVQASVIRAYVAAFYAVAAVPQTFVLQVPEFAAVRFF